MLAVELCYLGLHTMAPTWSNKQKGELALWKRLDKCYVVNEMEEMVCSEMSVNTTKVL